MYVDLLCQSNNFSYNSIIAQNIGVESAIYISAIMDLYMKAKAKNKIIDDKYFAVDYNEIANRTGLSKDKLKEIEEHLILVKIIEKQGKKNVYLNFNLLESLIKCGDEEFIADVKSIIDTNVVQERQRNLKEDYILKAVKNRISVRDPEIREAYEDWLDVVSVARVPSVALLKSAEQIVNEYAMTTMGRDANRALELLRFAAMYNYFSMANARNDLLNGPKKYVKTNMSVQSTVHSSNGNEVLDLAKEVFE